jgi:triosephosphate isomerase
LRTPIIAANWKMHKTVAEARDFCRAFLASYAPDGGEVVICPPFTALGAVAELLAGSVVKLGAQDLFWEEKGAYTGEISPGMLQDVGCDYVIIGHSERRGYFGETDADVNRKVKAALAHGLKPIICLGESLVQREAGQTEKVVTEQVRLAYEGVAPSSAEQTVIAYEPIWAIGTGRNASPEEANRVIGLIRQTVAGIYGDGVAEKIRIQYGGSVNKENIAQFMDQPEIDGALVGGASLDPAGFAVIARGGRS